MMTRSLLVGHLGVFVAAARFSEHLIKISLSVFGYKTVKQGTQDVSLEIPSAYGTAQIVSDAPNSGVQLGTLILLWHIIALLVRSLICFGEERASHTGTKNVDYDIIHILRP